MGSGAFDAVWTTATYICARLVTTYRTKLKQLSTNAQTCRTTAASCRLYSIYHYFHPVCSLPIYSFQYFNQHLSFFMHQLGMLIMHMPHISICTAVFDVREWRETSGSCHGMCCKVERGKAKLVCGMRCVAWTAAIVCAMHVLICNTSSALREAEKLAEGY